MTFTCLCSASGAKKNNKYFHRDLSQGPQGSMTHLYSLPQSQNPENCEELLHDENVDLSNLKAFVDNKIRL